MSEVLRVTHIYHGGEGRWVFLAGNKKGIGSQSVLRDDDTEFPMTRVKKWLNEGKKVDYIGYGDKTWVVIANRGDIDAPEPPPQKIYVGHDFPEDKIRDGWRDNYRIGFLNFCNGQWALIQEKNREAIVGQELEAFNDLEEAKARIPQWWKKNKAVHSMVYGNGKFYMVSQQGDNVPGQSFTANSDWPLQKITDYYANKRYIHCITYNTDEEYWVIIAGPLKGGQSVTTSAEYPYKKLKEMDDVYVYGKRD